MKKNKHIPPKIMWNIILPGNNTSGISQKNQSYGYQKEDKYLNEILLS